MLLQGCGSFLCLGCSRASGELGVSDLEMCLGSVPTSEPEGCCPGRCLSRGSASQTDTPWSGQLMKPGLLDRRCFPGLSPPSAGQEEFCKNLGLATLSLGSSLHLFKRRGTFCQGVSFRGVTLAAMVNPSHVREVFREFLKMTCLGRGHFKRGFLQPFRGVQWSLWCPRDLSWCGFIRTWRLPVTLLRRLSKKDAYFSALNIITHSLGNVLMISKKIKNSSGRFLISQRNDKVDFTVTCFQFQKHDPDFTCQLF